MATKSAALLGVALALMTTTTTSAQEERGGRGGYMRQLEWDCDNGDDDACERARSFRRHRREEHEWREQEQGDRFREPPMRRRDDWREREPEERRDHRQTFPSAPQVDPKVATCLAIETNYNNCVKQQQGKPGHQNDCVPWVVQLKANHCF